MNGKSKLDNDTHFLRVSIPHLPSGVTLPSSLGILAVTLMRKMLRFRAASVYQIALAICSIGICCLPPSVPAAPVKDFETREPFPPLASRSSDALGLTLAQSGPAGSHGLWWFGSCLLVLTVWTVSLQRGRICLAVWLGELLATCSLTPGSATNNSWQLHASATAAGALLLRQLFSTGTLL